MIPEGWWLEGDAILTCGNKESRMFDTISLRSPETSSSKTIKNLCTKGIEMGLQH